MSPLIALLAISLGQQGTSTLPDTVAGKRLDEFIVAFNTKDKKTVQDMVGRSFAPSALKILPKEEWASRIATAFNIAPISVDEVLKSSDNLIVVRIKSKSIQPLGIRLDLEPESPFAIVGARMASPSELTDSKAPRKYTKWAKTGELATMIRDDYKLPGLVIGSKVTSKKPDIASVGLRSTQGPEVIDNTDRIWVGAIGKLMTATLVAKMIEDKKLSWQTPLSAALSGISMLDDYKAITIEQLVHHQGNLTQHPMITGTHAEVAISGADSGMQARKFLVSVVLNTPPNKQPNTQFSDTDMDFVVAAHVLERLIGRDYEWLLNRYVFTPMKLRTVLIQPLCTDGQIGSPGSVFGHMRGDVGGYTPYLIPGSKLELAMAPAGSCISCSMEDLLKFAEFHLKGLQGSSEILTSESYQAINGDMGGKGLPCGWALNPTFADEACRVISSNNGIFATDLAIWPDAGIITAVSTNCAPAKRPSPAVQAMIAMKDRIEKKN